MPQSTKAQRLIQQARASIRQPKPTQQLREAEPAKRAKGYRVIAISLYTPEADWVDQTVILLQHAGSAKANRSLVVREAILRLQEELSGKHPGQILLSFAERSAKRAQGTARPKTL